MVFLVVAWPMRRKTRLCWDPVPPYVMGEQFGGLSRVCGILHMGMRNWRW